MYAVIDSCVSVASSSCFFRMPRTSGSVVSDIATAQVFKVSSDYSLTGIFPVGYIKAMNTWSALAEPNRLHIVELLGSGPLSVGEIADRLGLRQPQVSKHLRVLADAGIVEMRAVANRRMYSLRLEPFQALDAWLKTFRHVTNRRLDHLERYLRVLQGMDATREDE